MKPGQQTLAMIVLASVGNMMFGVANAQQVSESESGSRLTLEEIIVTGEKIQRSLMDTASSVSVLDADAIRRRAGLQTTADLLDRIPNLVTSETGNFAPAVRGADGTGPAQGADAFFAGTRPRLNYQIDGRTLSYNETIFSDATLWDVERVEVFRGPQSTLQGRNAIAGAVVIKTNDPTYEWGGAVRLRGGNFHNRQASAALSGPIVSDQVAVRLSADFKTSESFVNFTPFQDIEEPEEFKSLALRGKLLIEPASVPDLTARLTISHLDAHAPQANEVAQPFGDFEAAFQNMPRFGTKATTGIFDTTWDMNESVSFQVLASGADLRVNRWSPPAQGIAVIDAEEYVVEPRVLFSGMGNRLTGFFGLHIFDSSQHETIDLFGGGIFDDSTQTVAGFGEITFEATPSLSVTLGGRYEQEERDRDGGAGPFVISFHETYKEFLPKATVAWSVTDSATVGFTVARGYNGGGAGFTFQPPFVSYTFGPETVWNYEVFARAAMLENRITLTANAFYNDYNNMQLPFDLNPDPAVWSFVVRNADKVKTYGTEIGVRYLPLADLELFADIGLLETEVSSYPGSGIEGNELSRAPAVTFNAGFSYLHTSGFELGADVRFSDSYYSAANNDPLGRTDSYWVANAKVGYNFSNVRLFVEATNIFDSIEPVLINPGATRANDTATVLRPRAVTAGVSVTF